MFADFIVLSKAMLCLQELIMQVTRTALKVISVIYCSISKLYLLIYSVCLAVEALKQEKNSVKMLSDLMALTKEYLALWQIILENNFHATISNVHADLRTQLQSYCFADLVALSEANGLELISALVHYYLGDEAKTATINERLGNECPRLFTNDDANVLKATELIYNAKKSTDLRERPQLISQALTILKRHAKRVNLFEVVSLLKEG